MEKCEQCMAYADGGAVCEDHSSPSKESMAERIMRKRRMAKGGMVEELPEDDFEAEDDFEMHPAEENEPEEDKSLAGQIMKKRRALRK